MPRRYFVGAAIRLMFLSGCESPSTQAEPTPTMPSGLTPIHLEPMDTDSKSHPLPFTPPFLVNGLRFNAYAVDIYQLGYDQAARIELTNKTPGTASSDIAEVFSTLSQDDLKKELPPWSVLAADNTKSVILMIRENQTPTAGASPSNFTRVLVGEGSGQLSMLDGSKPKPEFTVPFSSNLKLSFGQVQSTVQEALNYVGRYSTNPNNLQPG